MMSPSSRARQTPTATASWPIATWRKPGSSPARKRSSTFSSKRRISSISRKHSRRSSRESVPVSSSLAIVGSLGTLGLVTEGWETEQPAPPPAALACALARDRFWQDPLRRLIGTHPRWPDAAHQLDVEEELAHALVLVLSRLAECSRRDFADVFYAERRGSGGELPRDERLRLALAAAV